MTNRGKSESKYEPTRRELAWGKWTDEKGVVNARYGSPYYKLSDPLGAGLPVYLEAIGWAVLGWALWRSRR